MAVDTIGYAALQIIPSMDRMTGNMQAQFAPFVQGAQRAGNDAGSALVSGVQAAQAAVAKATDNLAKSHDKVADAAGKVRVAEAKLEEIRNNSRATASQIAAAEERLETARRNSATAARNGEQAVERLAAAERDAANATDEVVRSGNGFKGMFSGLDTGIKQMAGLATAAAGVGGAMSTVGAAIEKEMGADKLAASLGASPELAAKYGAAASKAYAEGAGSSLGEVQNAVGLVQSSFSTLGFEGDLNIDEAASSALAFADIFDTDISGAVQAASTLVTSGLADGSEQAFDLMTTSFQKVPAAMRNELPEIIQEYGTNFRALGFSGEESFNLLVNAAGQGKFALDKTGDALKEFTIRGSDMSKTSVAAYEAVGLNAQEMSNAIAQGGPGAQDALKQTAAALNTIADPAEKANAAIALFGTPLEDLSIDQIPAFLDGLSGAAPAMEGFEGSLDSASATMYDNFGSKMEVLKRGFQDTFVNMVGDNVLPLLGDFSGALEENEGNALMAVAGMAGLGGAVAGFESAKGVFDQVSEGVTSVKDGFVSAKETAQGAWESVKAGASFAKTAASATADFAKTAASATINAAKTSAAWVASSARTVGALVAQGAAFTAHAIGNFAKAAAAATVNAATSAAAWVGATARTIGALALQGAAFLAQKTVLVASTVATTAAAAAQWALNVALNANPIALIIIAVTALVAGLVYFFTQTELGKQIVQAAWEGIQTAISFAWESIIKPVFAGFMAGLTAIGDGAMWFWNNAIVPAFDGVKAAISFVWGLIEGYFNLWKLAFTAIGDAALWLWNNAIVPAFDGVKATIGAAWDFMTGAFDNIKSGFGAVGDFFGQVGDTIGGVWDRIVRGVAKGVNAVGTILQKIQIPDWVPGVGGKGTKGLGDTLVNWSAQYLATGGQVAGRRRDGMLFGPGTGTSDSIMGIGTDGIPTAMVSAKEFVVNAKQTAANLPLLHAINSGALNLKDLLSGNFTPAIRGMFGMEEDDPRIRAVLGVGDLLRGNFSENTRTTRGVEEDNPIVGAFFGMRDRLLGLAGGGVVEGMTDWVSKTVPELQMTSGYRNTDNGHHSTGRAADFSNGSGNTDEQLALAKAIAAKYPNSLELIYDDPRFEGQEIKNGEKVDSSFYDEAGDHTNHVHWAMEQAPDMATAGGVLGDSDTSAALAGAGTSMSGGAAGGTGGGAGGASGGSSGGGGKFTPSALASTGGSFLNESGGVNISAGDAVPVWIVNWPEGVESMTSAAGGTGGGSGGSSALTTGGGDAGAPAALSGDSAAVSEFGVTGGGAAGLSDQDAVIAEFAKKGWGADTPEWAAAEWIIGKESGWKLDARNPESGAFGLFQFLGSTKDQYLPDESMDASVQGAAGAQYITDRYGDPLAAKKFWEENGWYDQGGTANGKGMMLKNVIQPEAVLSPEQTQAWLDLVPQLTNLVPLLEQFTGQAPGTTPDNRALLTQGQTFTAPAAVTPNATAGGSGVDANYGVDTGAAEPGTPAIDLSDGLASLPDIEAPKTGDPNVDKWTDWAAGLGNDVKGLFNKENLQEMLGTVVGLGLGGAGMAKYGGGDTYQITEAQNGRDTARAVSRVQRRRALAQQRGGGFGR